MNQNLLRSPNRKGLSNDKMYNIKDQNDDIDHLEHQQQIQQQQYMNNNNNTYNNYNNYVQQQQQQQQQNMNYNFNQRSGHDMIMNNPMNRQMNNNINVIQQGNIQSQVGGGIPRGFPNGANIQQQNNSNSNNNMNNMNSMNSIGNVVNSNNSSNNSMATAINQQSRLPNNSNSNSSSSSSSSSSSGGGNMINPLNSMAANINNLNMNSINMNAINMSMMNRNNNNSSSNNSNSNSNGSNMSSIGNIPQQQAIGVPQMNQTSPSITTQSNSPTPQQIQQQQQQNRNPQQMPQQLPNIPPSLNPNQRNMNGSVNTQNQNIYNQQQQQQNMINQMRPPTNMMGANQPNYQQPPHSSTTPPPQLVQKSMTPKDNFDLNEFPMLSGSGNKTIQKSNHPSDEQDYNPNYKKDMIDPKDPIGRYGLLGLMNVIKNKDIDLSTLSIGIDLTGLGLNLNSPDDLYHSFSSPWIDFPISRKAEYYIPLCYSTPGLESPTYKMSLFTYETLFYIFYSMPKDILQIHAAIELYDRDWRYHKEGKLWLTRVQGTESNITPNYEVGSFFFFDVTIWETVRRDNFYIPNDLLESKEILLSYINKSENIPI